MTENDRKRYATFSPYHLIFSFKAAVFFVCLFVCVFLFFVFVCLFVVVFLSFLLSQSCLDTRPTRDIKISILGKGFEDLRFGERFSHLRAGGKANWIKNSPFSNKNHSTTNLCERRFKMRELYKCKSLVILLAWLVSSLERIIQL